MNTQLKNIQTFKEFDQYLDGATAEVSYWGNREVTIPNARELIDLDNLSFHVITLIGSNENPGWFERRHARKVIEKINDFYLNTEAATIRNIFTSILFTKNECWTNHFANIGYGSRALWYLYQAKFDRYTSGTKRITPSPALFKTGPLSEVEIQLSRIFTYKEFDEFLDGAKAEVSFWGGRYVTIPKKGLTFSVDTLPYFVKGLFKFQGLGKSERILGRKVVGKVNGFYASTGISSITNPITLIFFLIQEFYSVYLNGGRYNSRNNWHRSYTQREFKRYLKDTQYIQTINPFPKRDSVSQL